ncbi:MULTISPECIES: PadR family transcriptional regulator [Methanobacterium]|jgi:DNA-binding PadR family transcriptional regulator|uniref:PadR family transcriptional regulator n=1 Tax=Methanobacterium veterum TaxID=408577 RepID=A0A9E5DJJ7_9EURY|nr:MULTISPECIES: PadR family transcriptional regulator [Methanobacterium]MCZ3366253.1 PadR family transcriptional regulator [Methanobacterium veterum]MCZ3371519.1 PadR family transcriptional regulator [Methanobacterium veterum]
MSRISDIETAILGLLYEKPQYGYQLEKSIESWGMRNWTQIGFSSIYYVLKKLEKKELVTSRLEKVEGKPSRKIFTITDLGRETMEEKLKELLSWNKKLTSPFDLGIAYLNYLEPQEVIECLENYIKSAEGRIKFLESSVKMQKELKAPYYVTALFSRPLEILKTEIEWVKQLIETIKKEENI